MRYNSEMLLRIAQGDTFGLAVEYVEKGHPNYDLAMQFDHYYSHPRWRLKAGNYSDDSQMSCACAEVIISGPPYTKEKFAKAFFDAFKRDPIKGYSQGLQLLLEQANTWEELVESIDANSNKNGAAMRSVPLGVLDDPKEILEVAKTQARITHNTAGGIVSSQLIALTSHYALYDYGPLEREPLLNWLSTFFPKSLIDILKIKWEGEVKGPMAGIKTAHAVIDLVTTQNNLLDILRKAFEFGGDVDSVASISLGIASSRMTDILPAFFEEELEAGKLYGPKYLRELGEKLIQPWFNKSLLKE